MLARCAALLILVLEGGAMRRNATGAIDVMAGIQLAARSGSASSFCSPEADLPLILNRQKDCRCLGNDRWDTCLAFVPGVSPVYQLFWYCYYSVLRHDCGQNFVAYEGRSDCGLDGYP